MKKNNKKKKLPRYWLGTRKPISLGYQLNQGIGDAHTTLTPGEDVRTKVRAMEQNQIPNTFGKLQQNAQFPLQALQNTTHLPATISDFTTVANPLTSTATNAASNFTTNFAGQGLGASLLNNKAAILDKVPQSTVNAGKTVLNTTGKVTGALGTAYGAYNVVNDIVHAGDGRSMSDMLKTRNKSTVTTAGGSQYEQFSGVDTAGEMEYEKQNRISKDIGLTTDAIGFGTSLGGLIGGLPGMIIGGLGGTLFGLGASLFGFGDNEDDVKWMAENATESTERGNRQSRSVAESQDAKNAFYGAANGKMPGLRNGKANARVSNGEIVGNFQDGYFRVPGSKNNKDGVKTHLGTQDFVISNKHGLSDYAWLTGDIPGALAAQSYLQKTGLMNKYKNGKLPGFIDGYYDAMSNPMSNLGVIAPHLFNTALNISQYNRARNASTYAPDVYVDNAEGRAAVNELAKLRFDPTEYLTDAQRALRQADWNVRRNVGLGMGGRAIAQNANFRAYLDSLRKIRTQENEANNGYMQAYANALMNLGTANQKQRMTALLNKHTWQQQANAKKENAISQYGQNVGTSILNTGGDLQRMQNYYQALAIQNRMLGLYDRQVGLDEKKYYNSLG